MQTTCGFGHIYDSEQYASCPYCNRGTRAIFFDAGGTSKTTMQGGASKTTMPDASSKTTMPSGQSAQQRTVAPEQAFHGDSTTIGKTEIPEYLRNRMEKEKRDKTVGIFQKKTGLDPVVGWLVCIEGPEKGRDYRLYSRINTIGRAEGNDVVIPSEQTISQKNHVRLAYDEKHNNYQMIPGEGTNITYVNDMPLYVPQLLHPYDVIEFGETKLIFIPLCTDKFRWK